MREYHYVGPIEILNATRSLPAGVCIGSIVDLQTWLQTDPTERAADGTWIATFTIGTDQRLSLAPRRSEHVACAAGGPVLSAGEVTIDAEWNVVAISNQSTGFCPEPDSWHAVQSALDHIGLNHPGEFTNAVIFRRCPDCNERNVVKDSWYVCQLCDATLPQAWNFS